MQFTHFLHFYLFVVPFFVSSSLKQLSTLSTTVKSLVQKHTHFLTQSTREHLWAVVQFATANWPSPDCPLLRSFFFLSLLCPYSRCRTLLPLTTLTTICDTFSFSLTSSFDNPVTCPESVSLKCVGAATFGRHCVTGHCCALWPPNHHHYYHSPLWFTFFLSLSLSFSLLYSFSLFPFPFFPTRRFAYFCYYHPNTNTPTFTSWTDKTDTHQYSTRGHKYIPHTYSSKHFCKHKHPHPTTHSLTLTCQKMLCCWSVQMFEPQCDRILFTRTCVWSDSFE